VQIVEPLIGRAPGWVEWECTSQIHDVSEFNSVPGRHLGHVAAPTGEVGKKSLIGQDSALSITHGRKVNLNVVPD
jgi:hypothetical protein